MKSSFKFAEFLSRGIRFSSLSGARFGGGAVGPRDPQNDICRDLAGAWTNKVKEDDALCWAAWELFRPYVEQAARWEKAIETHMANVSGRLRVGEFAIGKSGLPEISLMCSIYGRKPVRLTFAVDPNAREVILDGDLGRYTLPEQADRMQRFMDDAIRHVFSPDQPKPVVNGLVALPAVHGGFPEHAEAITRSFEGEDADPRGPRHGLFRIARVRL